MKGNIRAVEKINYPDFHPNFKLALLDFRSQKPCNSSLLHRLLRSKINQIQHKFVRNLEYFNFSTALSPNVVYYLFLLFLLSHCILNKSVATETDGLKIVSLGYIQNALTEVNTTDAKVAMEILFGKIVMRNLPEYRSEAVIFPDLTHAIQAFQAGDIGMLAMTSIDYLKARKQTKMTPAFVTHKGTDPYDEFLFVVHKTKGIHKLNQLQNKEIFVEKGFLGNIALMWLDALLLEHSLDGRPAFFKNVNRVLKDSKAVLSVFFGQADAGIVRQNTYENLIAFNPQLEKNLTVLHRSPGYLFTVIVFHPGLDEKIQKLSMNICDNLDDYPEGKQIYMLLHIKEISIYKPEYLINIEKLYEKHETIIKGLEDHKKSIISEK